VLPEGACGATRGDKLAVKRRCGVPTKLTLESGDGSSHWRHCGHMYMPHRRHCALTG
jgi:hypothetical protein